MKTGARASVQDHGGGVYLPATGRVIHDSKTALSGRWGPLEQGPSTGGL